MATFLKQCLKCNQFFRNEEQVCTKSNNWRIGTYQQFIFDCFCGTTNELLKSDLSRATEDLFLRKLSHQELPLLPHFVQNISKLLSDPNSTSMDIALAARRDPLVAATILQVANVRRYSVWQGKISSLEYAITYLGRTSVEAIVFMVGLTVLRLKTKQYRISKFWQQSFLVGSLCERLQPIFSPKISHDEAYIAGTLCNLGKVFNAFFFPLVTDQVEQLSATRKLNWFLAEDHKRLAHHTTTGAFLSRFWKLPEFVLDACARHHDLPRLDVFRSSELEIWELVGFANQLAHLLGGDAASVDFNLLHTYKSLCRLSDQDLRTLCQDLEALVQRSDSIKLAA